MALVVPLVGREKAAPGSPHAPAWWHETLVFPSRRVRPSRRCEAGKVYSARRRRGSGPDGVLHRETDTTSRK